MPFRNGYSDFTIVSAWHPQFFDSHGLKTSSASLILVRYSFDSIFTKNKIYPITSKSKCQ